MPLSQSLINQGYIPILPAQTDGTYYIVVAIPYKSGIYSNPRHAIRNALPRQNVAIPYKSGIYSNFHSFPMIVWKNGESQSLINQGYIPMALWRIPRKIGNPSRNPL